VDAQGEEFLKTFFREVMDRPLDPASDRRYVRLYEGPDAIGDDPVLLLERAIRWLPGESVQLLSGFRGTGKSTELRRLRSRLRDKGYLVALVDIQDYINLTTRVDVSDFLVALAGAFGEALSAPDMLAGNQAREGYWSRFVSFLERTKLAVPDVSPGGVKVNLKSDPTFKQQLQERMAGHVGALVTDVRAFFAECVEAVRKKHGAEAEIVLIVDSAEQIRGTSVNAEEVQASVETLFAGHAEKLRIPDVHMVYTVPPYLKVRYQNLGNLYRTGAVQIFPAVKVRDTAGQVHDGGMRALRKVLEARGDVDRLFGDARLVDKVILASGGHLRDLLRIVSEVLRRVEKLPVDEQVVDAALNQIRTEFLPIADEDAVWLARVAASHEASLSGGDHVPDLAHFLDTHLVLCYRDGPEWYDVHPLIKELMVRQGAEVEARARAAG